MIILISLYTYLPLGLMHAFDQSVELTAAPVSVEKGAGGILWGEDTNRGDKLFNLMVEPGV